MRPRKLDVCCCQGGASQGYHDAGFSPYGIDNEPQPRYPYPFHQGDAVAALVTLSLGGMLPFTHPDGTVEWLGLADFAAFHASPPCQAFTLCQRIMGNEHPDLVTPIRALFESFGKPYIIENVPGAPLIDPVELCGAMFGLRTYRHRLFESNIPLEVPEHPEHVAKNTKMGRPVRDGEFMHIVGNFAGADLAREVMGMPWATRDGLREAIPTAYTAHLGAQLIDHLESEAAA